MGPRPLKPLRPNQARMNDERPIITVQEIAMEKVGRLYNFVGEERTSRS
jgi:hypothetical protein